MYKSRFEKFEMKYGYYLPEEYKRFIMKYGGDIQFGTCRFDYPENLINNITRIPGEMDFHLIPFGDIGNGDYYCFYRYGFELDKYFIGIWLHETRNFVILTSNFRSFIYKCLLDDYLSTVVPNEELSDGDYREAVKESLDRCKILQKEMEFNFERVTQMKNEFDYHRLMIEQDERAVQSLCFLGRDLVKKREIKGFDLLEAAKNAAPFYTAPYYLLGKIYQNLGKDNRSFYSRALRTSLVSTGYSYWQEDYLGIPEDSHREIALFMDKYLDSSKDSLEIELYNGRDPYDYELRFELAKESALRGDFKNAMQEYNNAVYCCDSKNMAREILKEALRDAKKGEMSYLGHIVEHDIKMMR